MSLYPMECHPVPAEKLREAYPEVRVLDFCEAFSLPVLQPSFIDGLDHIGGIAVDMYFRIFPSDGFETSDDSQKFHAVVGRKAESFRHFLDVTGTLQDDPIASRAGIAARCTVGVQIYRWSVVCHR